MVRTVATLLLLTLSLGACATYRMASLDSVTIPNYDPRPIAIPPSCEPLIARAAAQGMSGFTETEARELLFCQQQQIIRAQEEEAAAARLEAHAAAARFALQTATFVIGGLVAILAWVF